MPDTACLGEKRSFGPKEVQSQTGFRAGNISSPKALQNQNVLCLWPARCATESCHPRTQARRPRPTQSSSRTGTAKYFSLSIAMQRQEPGDVGSPSSVNVATRRAEVARGSLAKDYHWSHLDAIILISWLNHLNWLRFKILRWMPYPHHSALLNSGLGFIGVNGSERNHFSL
jgi:hypothetical protein